MSNEEFGQALEGLFAKGNDYLTAKQRDRPYNGQAQTDQGERGKQEVYGVTMRDIADCIVIGMFHAGNFQRFGVLVEKRLAEGGEFPDPEETLRIGTIHDLPWEQMDPLAVIQNATCELERRMGIYPNVPPVKPAPDSAPGEATEDS